MVVAGLRLTRNERIATAVHAGKIDVAPNLLTDLFVGEKGAHTPDRHDDLTDCERELLEGVLARLSNKEIGHGLGAGEKTVKYRMRSILQKLQVRSRTEAALLLERSKHLNRFDKTSQAGDNPR